jgi:hemerythrin-like domain-containing protein
MKSTTPVKSNSTTLDGFDVLDVCHRDILVTLGKLSALIARLEKFGPDAEARSLAREIGLFFSSNARQHHEDEERHVFPKLLSVGDAELTRAVLRLQQDHGWIEEDWLEMSPQIDAVAAGLVSYDINGLRASAEVFTALLHEHIALEESLIYPHARTKLRVSEQLEMGREMASRRRRNAAASRR